MYRDKDTLLRKRRFAFAIASICVLFGSTLPVSAQEPRKGFRETIGCYKTSGWEHQLVQGDQNLGHWYWSPMVSYVQAGSSQNTGKQARSADPMNMPQVSHYIKPIHAPTIVPNHGPYVIVRHDYVYHPPQLVASARSHSTSDTSCRLMDTSARLVDTGASARLMISCEVHECRF